MPKNMDVCSEFSQFVREFTFFICPFQSVTSAVDTFFVLTKLHRYVNLICSLEIGRTVDDHKTHHETSWLSDWKLHILKTIFLNKDANLSPI